jgi:hypothetical protein
MDTKFVSVGSVVMMAKENKINMQIAGSQDIQFIKGSLEDQLLHMLNIVRVHTLQNLYLIF